MRYAIMIGEQVVGHGPTEAAAWHDARTEADRVAIDLDGARAVEYDDTTHGFDLRGGVVVLVEMTP